MKLSIVTTMYYSTPYIHEFYERITTSAQKITDDYEIIFVNDGSPDDSLEVSLQIQKLDNRITVIDLSRNFGQHKAVMAGLSFASGELIFLIACDLEEVPENLPLFHETLFQNPDCDVIYGVQEKRKGSLWSRANAQVFYKILNYLSDEKLDASMVFSRLMTKRYVQSLLQFKEHELFIVGLWKITGFKQKALTIETRHKGVSSYTLKKKAVMAVNAITSFSNKPLIFIFYMGVFLLSLSFLYIFYLFFTKLFVRQILSGWTSLMISIWMVGGLNILLMGIIGIYLSRVFIETKKRPYIIVKSVHKREKETSLSSIMTEPDANLTESDANE